MGVYPNTVYMLSFRKRSFVIQKISYYKVPTVVRNWSRDFLSRLPVPKKVRILMVFEISLPTNEFLNLRPHRGYVLFNSRSDLITHSLQVSGASSVVSTCKFSSVKGPNPVRNPQVFVSTL